MRKKSKLQPGMRVRTNAAWERRIHMESRTGVVVRPDPTIERGWYVKLDGIEGLRPLVINESWLEEIKA